MPSPAVRPLLPPFPGSFLARPTFKPSTSATRDRRPSRTSYPPSRLDAPTEGALLFFVGAYLGDRRLTRIQKSSRRPGHREEAGTRYARTSTVGLPAHPTTLQQGEPFRASQPGMYRCVSSPSTTASQDGNSLPISITSTLTSTVPDSRALCPRSPFIRNFTLVMVTRQR